MASILLNSSSLLRIDLDGVNVLAPSLVAALEAVLPEREVSVLVSDKCKKDGHKSVFFTLSVCLSFCYSTCTQPHGRLSRTRGQYMS